MRLSIGCGTDYKELQAQDGSWEGLDIQDYGQKYICDLETDGLRDIRDNSVDEIRAWNIFEHLDQFVENKRLFVLNECHRVLTKKPKGVMDLIVPRWPTGPCINDPTHKSFYTVEFFQGYLCGKRPFKSNLIDHKGDELKKWEIENDSEGYTWTISDKIIHIRIRP